jgi:general secretion pathway protein G
MNQRHQIETVGRTARGFTLLELMVVLVILVLLSSIAAPQVLKYLGRAKSDTAKLQIDALSAGLDLYHIDVGHFPSPAQGLAALVRRPDNEPKWDGPYVKKDASLVDPWGQPYVYRLPGQHGPYDVLSYAADGQEGGEGDGRDITNW